MGEKIAEVKGRGGRERARVTNGRKGREGRGEEG